MKCKLNRNILKIIAAISMLIDHIGYIFFPNIKIFRIIGRISLPIFAFMIAEGCKYTKNKLFYFLKIFLLATICQIVYTIYNKDLYLSILFTFSLSIIMIYTLQNFKNNLFYNSKWYIKLISGLLFLFSIIGVYIINCYVKIDYGFWGCMLPVFASLFQQPEKNPNKYMVKTDKNLVHVFLLSIGLLLLLEVNKEQIFSFLAIPLLVLYSSEKGKLNLKYFFYIFYPVHLVVLEFIRILIT